MQAVECVYHKGPEIAIFVILMEIRLLLTDSIMGTLILFNVEGCICCSTELYCMNFISKFEVECLAQLN